MTDHPADDNAVLSALDHARPAGLGGDDGGAGAHAARSKGAPDDDSYTPPGEEWSDGERPSEDGPIDPDRAQIVRDCAALDPSDTDNGRRLIAHFGGDLAVQMEIGGKRGEHSWVAWTGTHWDMRDGGNKATIIAQKIGALIALEADHLSPPEADAAAIAAAEAAAPLLRDETEKFLALDDEDMTAAARKARQRPHLRDMRRLKKLVDAGASALARLEKRRDRRRAFGVTAKNAGRINSMLSMAGPHLVVEPEAWDADQRLTYVANGALRFSRVIDEESPDDSPDAKPRFAGEVEFIENGFRREDRVTRVVPFAYRPDAPADKWRKMLERFLPDSQVRLAVQIFCGLGLTGLPIQMLFFHFGKGANGKSVFLEVLTRVLGPLAEGLPPTSITGSSERGQGAASPDIAKLEGARFVRVAEVPEGEMLREELVKALTGGEKMESRALFKGYHSFQPQFKAHMSGNGYPRISGSNEGIWRRMVVVPWTVTIPVEERRDFEPVVAELMTEAEGILAWMVEGMMLFDRHGLIIPQPMREASKAYRDQMDPTTLFFEECVIADETAPDLPARAFYGAYLRWSKGQSRPAKSETKFGLEAGQRFERARTGAGMIYRGVRLQNVPAGDEDDPPPHDANPRDS